MARMTFIMPDGESREVDAPVGDTVLAIAQRNGIAELEGACEGAMACSTCHVIVDKDDYGRLPEPTTEEDDMLDFAYGLSLTSRLGCQIVITAALDGLVVRVPSERFNALLD
ncbi:MAG: ferredoxin family 2Fe-2S iron-sulfur cluster binding protein [Proteobacteria bacterium]|nr:ferredoxin family 2Fe-2S iron-sulfur cluster binding protein [Pseudomonadota bacterium]MDA1058157.1 ferredoxin family 2Fe-2S iron-sulfur cluster binding protein [Pseudomonadota bacterium]